MGIWLSGGLGRAGLTIGLDLRGLFQQKQFYGSVIGLLTSVLYCFSNGKWAYVAAHKNLSSLTSGKVSEVHVGLVVETMIMCNMKNHSSRILLILNWSL